MDFLTSRTVFDTQKIQNGMAVSYLDGTNTINGFVSNVESDTLHISYFNASLERADNMSVSIDTVLSGKVRLVFNQSTTSNEFTKTESKTSSFSLDSLKNVTNVDALLKLVQDFDAQTIAVIASYLNSKVQAEFLYRLPESLLPTVKRCLDNTKGISGVFLSQIEKKIGEKWSKLQDTFQTFQQKQAQKEENKQAQSQNPFDNIGDVFGTSPIGDVFKKFLNNSPKPDGKIDEMFKKFLDNSPKPSGQIEDLFNQFFGGKKDSAETPKIPSQQEVEEMLREVGNSVGKVLNDLLRKFDDDEH